MTDLITDRDPPAADIVAAEYVLGLLDDAGRRDARLRAARDRSFARLVDDWTDRLAPLCDEVGDEAPPAHVWPRVRSRLGWSPVDGARAAAPAGLAFWRSAAAAGFAAAAVLAVVAMQKPRQLEATRPVAAIPAPVPVTPSIPEPRAMVEMPVSRLVSDKGATAFLATADMQAGGIWLVPVPGTVHGDGRVPVLWLIPAGKAPMPMGFLAPEHSHWVSIPRELMQAGVVLAVTMEPAGDAPPPKPSVAPMATGSLSL